MTAKWNEGRLPVFLKNSKQETRAVITFLLSMECIAYRRKTVLSCSCKNLFHNPCEIIREGMMKRRILTQTLLMVFILITAGCATLGSAGHKYLMRGQVLEVMDGEVYLCIGSKDGAAVGQEYTVYRSVKEWNPAQKYRPFQYKRVETGKIKIQEIVDDHYATAKILMGDVKENDLAELRP